MILENIIIIIICIILSICLILFINRDKINLNYFNCCKKCKSKDDLSPMNIIREELKNNSLEDNIKLIKNMDDSNKEMELL